MEVLDGRCSAWMLPPLLSCGSADLVWLAMCLGMFMTGWTRQRRVETLVAEGPDAVARVSVAGSTALADWPVSLEAFLTEQRGRSSARKGTYGARKSLGDFYGWLTALEDGPMKTVVAEAARDYVARDPGLARRSHRSRLVAPTEHLDLIGLKEAAALIGVSGERVKRMMAARELPQSDSEGRGVPMLIDRSAVEAAAGRLHGTLDFAATARALAISKSRLRRVVDAGLLLPVHRADESGTATWAFERREVNGFLEKTVFVRAPRRKGEQAVGFEFAAESLRRHGIDFVRFLQFVLAGDLPVIGLDRRAVGLKRLRFAANAVRELGRDRGAKSPITIQAAGESLGLKWQVVANLVERGLLQAVDGVIPLSALAAFKERHVTGAELARISRTSPRALAQELERRGILPVTGPRVDGSRQNIYCRGAVATLSP